MSSLEYQLENLLNQYCIENGSNTPDFILAQYLLNCLRAYESAVNARDKWFGIAPTPGDAFRKSLA
jgi:hypothetical protein